MASEEVLRLEDVEAGYEGVEVIRGVSLTVKRGEKVVIMGPSGSGKSTLLKVAVLLVKPSRGKVFLDGEELTSGSVDLRKARAKTGFVFQSYNLFPHMKVVDNVALPLRIVKGYSKEDARRTALELLRQVGLAGFEEKYPLQLSGGQQQRVAIARALAMDPVILFLDEPTSALDPELKAEVIDVLLDVAKRNIAMLAVTHELDFAREVADRIAVMEHGKIIEEGPASKILDSPSTERVKAFLKLIRK
ncbi:MAG: amino acid ABC transporter ATP-binding protein [Thermofilum sp.]|uniref:ABC transporter related protein n=1 Tax=Thermofilum adornatum 1505 TaxID=697581 RepID=A0A3G1A7T2_9CREN|nr:amino acid ABC transporter ATP-binding protein [Thermofilum adornatum]AJB41354.1 ABC transporter related protein [Thermofilum adornatum 1505]